MNEALAKLVWVVALYAASVLCTIGVGLAAHIAWWALRYGWNTP